jgi:hypothetical protein
MILSLVVINGYTTEFLQGSWGWGVHTSINVRWDVSWPFCELTFKLDMQVLDVIHFW